MGILDKLFGPPDIEKLKKKRDADGLIKALSHKDPGISGQAARTLGELGDRRAVKPLIATLEDEYHSPLRHDGEAALEKLGDAAVEPLIVALKDDKYEVRSIAACVLGTLGDRRAVEPLILALKDKNQTVRRNAAKALGLLGEAQAVEPLVAVLRAEVMAQRDYEGYGMVGMLRKLGDARTAEFLTATFKAGDLGLHESVVRALERIGGTEAEEALAEYRQATEANAEKALAGAGPLTPACSSCGTNLSGGESVFRGAPTIVLTDRPRSAEDVESDYALFNGVVCLSCRTIFCLKCLGKQMTRCPKCDGETEPAYLKHIKALQGSP